VKSAYVKDENPALRAVVPGLKKAVKEFVPEDEGDGGRLGDTAFSAPAIRSKDVVNLEPATP
jgi:hypothetical protein